MNERDRLDRMLAAWADEAWSPPPPAYLGEVLARTRHTRQRRSWASLERWLPMELTLRRPTLATPLRLLAIVLALLLLLIAALSMPLLFGTRSLPAVTVQQFQNGLITWAKDGDIWVVDPEVDEPRLLIGGPDLDDWPDWSPDGTRIAFQRAVGMSTALMVADADGTNAHQVTPDGFPVLDWWMWSPDGSRFALASTERALSSISVVGSDGSNLQRLDAEYAAYAPYWAPDGRSLLVRMRTPDGTGLFPVSFPDLVIGEPIALSATDSEFYAGDRGDSDFMEALYSSDGSQVAYIQGQLSADGTYGVFGGPDTRNHVMDADGTDDRIIEYSPESDYEDGMWFSPDGRRMSMVIRKGDYHQIAIMTLDGTAPAVATEPELDPNAMPAWWSPDGTQILAVRIEDGISYLIDPDTGEKVRQPWSANWADWQPIPVAS